MMRDAWLVYAKELTDALRDRRTLLMVLLSSVAIGPLVLMLVSSMVAGMEQRAEAREIMVQGLEHAPSLRNYLQRQTYSLLEAPADYEQQLRNSHLAHPVLVVPVDFESEIARGVAPVVELVSSAANQRAQTGTAAIMRLLRGFNQEQATLRLAVRGAVPLAYRSEPGCVTVHLDLPDAAGDAGEARTIAAPLDSLLAESGLLG